MTAEYRFFPYEIVRDAKRGLQAWQALENDDFPVKLREEIEDPDLAANPVTFSQDSGQEYLLITGGFFQNMDKYPEFGCIAWIIDRSGKIVKTWTADPNDFLDGMDHVEGDTKALNIYISGISLDDDGNIIAVFQGRNTFPYQIGMAKFSQSGEMLWRRHDHTHHWATILADGSIAAPSSRFIPAAEFSLDTNVQQRCTDDVVQSQGVRIVSPSGDLIEDLWFDEMFAKAGLNGVLSAASDACNPHHVNGIATVTEAGAQYLNHAKAGDLAVSLRTPSVVAIVNIEEKTVVDVVGSYFAAQHSPNFLADGSLVVFDNQGGQRADGGTRILAIKSNLSEMRTIFPNGPSATPFLPFASVEEGVTAISADGTRVLISESLNERYIEVDASTGAPLWAMESVANMAPFLDSLGVEYSTGHNLVTAKGAYYVPTDHIVLQGLGQ